MEDYKIGTETVTFYGKKRGSNKNKFNRVNKLASKYNELHAKFMGMAERGFSSCTESYRCSVAVLLMMETGIRIGNENSAEGYHTVPHPHAKSQESKFVKTYGLTTLTREHVSILSRLNVWFDFVGKKQVENRFHVPSNLNKYIIDLYTCECHKVSDYTLFGITDYQLTKFIKKYVGSEFTPKDFRTLRANIYAFEFARYSVPLFPSTKKQQKADIKSVCEHVSKLLNNTPSVCKTSYINPELLSTELAIF
jgi:DNA topoisomerase IB